MLIIVTGSMEIANRLWDNLVGIMLEQAVVNTLELTTQQEPKSRSQLDAVYDITQLILEDYRKIEQACLNDKSVILDRSVRDDETPLQVWQGNESIIDANLAAGYIKYSNGLEFWEVFPEGVIYTDQYGQRYILDDVKDERLLALCEYLQKHLGFFVDRHKGVSRKCTVYNH